MPETLTIITPEDYYDLSRRFDNLERRLEAALSQLEGEPVKTNWISTWKASQRLGIAKETLEKYIARDLELKQKDAIYKEGYNVRTISPGEYKVAEFWLMGRVVPMNSGGFLKVG